MRHQTSNHYMLKRSKSNSKIYLCWIQLKLFVVKVILIMKRCQPSPARYTLPPTVGFRDHDIRKNRLPAYSFGLRLHDLAHGIGPAPNQYAIPSTIGGKDKTKERAPAYSMHGQLSTKGDYTSPGPGAYSLQGFKPGERAPAYSMGARLKDIYETVEC